MSKVKGTWGAFEDDFLVRYQGRRRIGSVAYGSTVNRKGDIKATVWFDKDQDGRKDSNERTIAVYRADAYYVYNRLDYFSVETGRFTADDWSGKFRLIHEGYSFAKGRITDLDYFFG